MGRGSARPPHAALMPSVPVRTALVCVLLVAAGGCDLLLDEDPFLRIHPFEFSHDADEWSAGFSGYPADLSAKDLGLTFDHRLLPRGVEETGTALYLAGDNREKGDSLFMFVKREITDLSPSTNYRVHMTLKVTSTSPSELCRNQVLPFDDPIRAFIKVGAFHSEPTVDLERGYRRFEVEPAPAAPFSGRLTKVDTIEHSLRNCGYPGGFHVLRTYNHNDQVRVTTDSTGSLWTVVGLDTRFGVETTFYIKSIKLFIRGQKGPGP